MSYPGPQRPGWAPADLARRLCAAFHIAGRTLEFLGADGYRDENEPEGSFGPDKPFAETAMLLYVASGVTGEQRVSERSEALATVLAAKARTHRTACAIAAHPTICLQLAMPHVLLSRMGLKDPHFDEILGLSIDSTVHHGQEVVPHRALERMWIAALWHDALPGAAFDAVANASVLNHPVDLLWGTRTDAYAHTHAFMYFTNFGYWHRPLPRSRTTLLEESAALLARSLLFEDYDLAAEVLMIWPLTNAPWRTCAAFGFRVLAELEDAVGFLPAQNGTPEQFLLLTGNERKKYALAASYHTAFVMGMLCALCLRAAHAMPAEIMGPTRPIELIAELLCAIPKKDTPWRRSFDRLTQQEQQTLAPFLLDMALLSRGRDNDFAAVGYLLELAVQYNLADAPLCAQSAQLLHRMRICSEGAVSLSALQVSTVCTTPLLQFERTRA